MKLVLTFQRRLVPDCKTNILVYRYGKRKEQVGSMPSLYKQLNTYYLSLLLDTRSFVGQSPHLFGLVQKCSPTRRIQNVVERNTDLCIEAPSGSGSSYFVNGFLMINPDLRIAHHHHVAAQVMRSVRFKVPTVVILRDPIDCVVSRTAFWNTPILIGAVFRQWIRFFRSVEQVRDHILIASFESVTRKPEEVVKAININFDTTFNYRFPRKELITASMDRAYSQITGRQGHRNPNLPSVDKESVKTRIQPFVAVHRLAQPACDLYSRLVDTDI